jgi:hypothetical protein
MNDTRSTASSTTQQAGVKTINDGYRGFPSREAYLEALEEWADSQRYYEPETSLRGFYGETTLESYASRPKHEFGITRWLRERKERTVAKHKSDWTTSLRKAA